MRAENAAIFLVTVARAASKVGAPELNDELQEGQ